MKRFFIILSLSVLILLTTVALFPPNYPPIPEIQKELTATVNYSFDIHSFNGTQVELAHTNKGKPLFLNMKVSGSWETRRPSLYLTSAGQRATTKGNGKNAVQNKGFERFKKDNSGKTVSQYRFSNTLVEGKDGKHYLKMVYSGPDMPMIGTMTLQKKIVFPAFIAKDFGVKRSIILKPGTYTLDQKSKGFLVEIEKS